MCSVVISGLKFDDGSFWNYSRVSVPKMFKIVVSLSLNYRAAWYTAGVVGGLTTVAVTAPSEKFLYMGGPLAMGFGVVFMASIGSAFLPPTTALGAGLYSISLYGGLVLFSGFMLYNTQKIIHR